MAVSVRLSAPSHAREREGGREGGGVAYMSPHLLTSLPVSIFPVSDRQLVPSLPQQLLVHESRRSVRTKTDELPACSKYGALATIARPPAACISLPQWLAHVVIFPAPRRPGRVNALLHPFTTAPSTQQLSSAVPRRSLSPCNLPGNTCMAASPLLSPLCLQFLLTSPGTIRLPDLQQTVLAAKFTQNPHIFAYRREALQMQARRVRQVL